MRKFKQLVAVILCIATIASLLTFSVTASAEENLPAVTITDEDLLLIEKLEALGVITNEYGASSYVTRRQMAEIIKTYMGLPAESVGSGEKQFNDVPISDPGYGAISTLRDLEVITGDGNNNFNPDNYVNYNEAVVFIINAVGHKYFAQREGGYPTGYMRVAIKHDMLEDINMTNGKSDVPVIDVYKMLDKALDAATIIPQYYGDGSVRYTISETDTFLSETYGIYKYRGQVTGNEFTSLTSASLDITDEQIEIDHVIYDTPGYVYGYFLGYTVDYYVKHVSDGKELVYVEETPKRNSTIEIDSEDILTSKVTSDRIYYEDENNEEEHINIDAAADVIYNNQCYTGFGVISNIMPANGYIEALDNDSDGVYEVLFIYDYEVVVVDSVDAYEEVVLDEITGGEIDLSQRRQTVNIISAKEQISIPFDGIKAGDVLSIAKGRASEKIITVYVSTESVNGKITGYRSDLDSYEIDGNFYEETYNYNDDELKVGVSGKFLLDMSGKIAAYEYSSEDDATMYAAMAGVDYKHGSMNPDIKVKIYTSNGMFVTASLKENIKINNRRFDLSKSEDVTAALDLLCKGYTDNNGKYVVNDSYVLKYSLTSDGQISYIDTGAQGGVGNLNPFADHYLYCASRQGPILMMTPTTDMTTWETDAIYTRLASNAVVFITPKSGELNDETGYGLLEKWDVDYCYANIDANAPAYVIFGGRTKVIDNFTAYHTGSDEIPVARAMILRGGSAGTAVSGSSKMYLVTEIADSTNADAVKTKTLYEEDIRLGQLADTIKVTVQTVETEYTINGLMSANILKPGTIIRYGTNEEGYIHQISVVAEYDATNKLIVPKFTAADAGNKNIGNTRPVSASGSNTAVVVVNKHDAENMLIDFTAGAMNLVCDMKYASSVKIWDSATNSVREGTAADIRKDDQCALRLDVNFRVMEIVILR